MTNRTHSSSLRRSPTSRKFGKIASVAVTVFATTVGFGVAVAAAGCSQTRHPVVLAEPLDPGPGDRSFETLVAALDEPGPIRFEKHIAADWKVPLGGLLNLDHPDAEAAHFQDELEPIQVYFYVLGHPDHGDFLVDSGIARSVAEGKDMPVRFPVNWALPMDHLEVHLDTKTYLESRSAPLAGVFLTHLHLDHILGLEDVPKETPLYIGPGEANDSRITHLLMRPTTDLNLQKFGPLRQWRVIEEPGAPFAFVDVFGDGSVLGLHVPGHTQGNMAFLVRSRSGPQLLVGDGSHTAWGWEHGVEPGSFNTDMNEAAESLDKLKRLAARIPRLEVHLGHQSLHPERTASSSAGSL